MWTPALVLLVAVLSGCATGPKYGEVAPAIPTLKPEKARLTFLRAQRLLYMGLDASVEINGLRVASLSNGAFTYSDQTPGRINISVDNWSFPGRYVISVDIKPATEHYFEIFPRSESFGPVLFGYIGTTIDAQVNQNSGAFKVVPISKEAAMRKLSELSFTQ